MTPTTELSLVVPTYNEIGNVDEFVRRVTPILEDVVGDKSKVQRYPI